MKKAVKRKPLTLKEKKLRAEIRQKLRNDGVLPPVKKPLNRKKFVAEARADYEENLQDFVGYGYVLQGIFWMLASGIKPTLETIGVAKVLKIACEIKCFEAEKSAAGLNEYKVSELYDRLQPIIDA